MDNFSSHHLLGLDHALGLAAAGWPVVPYLDNENGTQLPKWSTSATTNTDQILEWFDVGQPYQDCYVATIPGDVGRCVIDIDRHPNGADGFETLKSLQLTSTALVQGTSRSGKGRHLYYKGVGTSKRIYAGVDRKSLRGLVRVTYSLPDVEDVYEELPAGFRVFNNDVTGREFEGTLVSWIDMHAGKPVSNKVSAVKDSAPKPFKGHDELLRVQTCLIKLAGEGEGGVPEALLDLQQEWLSAEHRSGGVSPSTEWIRALAGGITSFGGDVPEPTMDSSTPDDFFEKSRLKAKTLAKAISGNLALGLDGDVWLYEGGVWLPRSREIEKRTVRALGDRFSSNHIRTMQAAVTSGCDLPNLTQLPDTRFINLKNGMFDWASGTLYEHDPKYLSTVQLNVEYDATSSCPQFESWLEEVVPEDARQLVWEVLGYMFYNGNPFSRAMLLLGTGGTGKSTFLRVLQHMLGTSNVSTISLRAISEDEFARATLFGKIANICGDIDAKFLEDSSMFKAITGGDMISAQHKFKNPFSFTPWAVPIFSANKIWRTNDDSEGYMRRWLLLPFPNKVDRSKAFDESLLFGESAGIFLRAMASLRELMARGNFEPSGSAESLLEEFKVESDVVRLWLRDDERITVDETSKTSRTDIYNRYKQWCAENGYKSKGSSELYKSLRALAFEECRINGFDYFRNLKLNQSTFANNSMNY